MVPELKAAFPDAPYIARPGQINAWDNQDFVQAIKDTGKKQLLVAGIVQSRRLSRAGIRGTNRARDGRRHCAFRRAGRYSEADTAPREDLYGYAGKHFDYATALPDVPVFLGCHERDPHIALARVRESEAIFKTLGATVTTRIHSGAGHGVSETDIPIVRELLE